MDALLLFCSTPTPKRRRSTWSAASPTVAAAACCGSSSPRGWTRASARGGSCGTYCTRWPKPAASPCRRWIMSETEVCEAVAGAPPCEDAAQMVVRTAPAPLPPFVDPTPYYFEGLSAEEVIERYPLHPLDDPAMPPAGPNFLREVCRRSGVTL